MLKDLSLSIIIGAIFILYALSGSTAENANMISFALFFVWFGVSLISNPKSLYYTLKRQEVKLLITYILFLFFASIYVGGVSNGIKLVSLNLLIFSPFFLFNYYVYSNTNKLKLISILSFLFFLYYIIRSLIFYSVYDDAARVIAADKFAYGDIAIGGGYSLAYASAILSTYLFDLLVNKRISNYKIRLFTILSILLMFYIVIDTKSTLTILWLFFGFLFVLLSRRKINLNGVKRRHVSHKILFFIVVILFISFYNTFGEILINTFGANADVISLRLTELGKSMSYGMESSDYSQYRFGRYLFSIRSFIESPFIGNGYKYGYIYKNSLPYIGGHSEWFDSLANNGLFGAVPFFLIIYYAIKKDRSYSKYLVSNSYILVIFFLGMFNPLLQFQTMLVIALIIPSISILISCKKNN